MTKSDSEEMYNSIWNECNSFELSIHQSFLKNIKQLFLTLIMINVFELQISILELFQKAHKNRMNN